MAYRVGFSIPHLLIQCFVWQEDGAVAFVMQVYMKYFALSILCMQFQIDYQLLLSLVEISITRLLRSVVKTKISRVIQE